MKFPKTIENRCVLYDVFTEVHAATIEPLKSHPAVAEIYDYGVDCNGYHLVMKRYKYSLKQWRDSQSQSLKENLPLYLSLYKDVLKAVELLHNNNITHYDIKADNVFLEIIDPNKNPNEFSETNFNVAIGDFGQWKMFISNEDEFCEKNRGTEVIMSPEMFMLAINIRKDTEKYDRRKRMGTNRLSDIWSLGWLFFELLAGKILFQPQDLFKLTAKSDDIIPEEKYELLDKNVYLIDFLKFMLVKDPHFRPSISAVIKRFEHVHALLVVTGPSQLKISSNKQLMTESVMMRSLQESVSLLNLEHEKRIFSNPSEKFQPSEQQIAVRSIMRINEDISYWSKEYLKVERNLADMSITHIISMASQDEMSHLNQEFDILYIDEFYTYGMMKAKKISYPTILGSILDFMRKAKIRKGKILFVEDDELLDSTSPKSIVGEYIILALSRVLSVPAYEIYTMIRTSNPIFDIAHPNLRTISLWSSKQIQIQNYLKSLPTLECLWGSNCIILKRQFGSMNNMYSVNWNCLGNRSFENSNCPSPSCFNFIMYMRKINSKVKYDRLKWGYLGKEDFILGPHKKGIFQGPTSTTQRQILTGSLAIDYNCESFDPIQKLGDNSDTEWVIYKCKYWYVWMYSYNREDDCYAILLNNQVKPSHSGLSRH